MEVGADLACEQPELLDRRRPVDVAARQQDFLALNLAQPLRELGAGGRLARSLQAGHQDHRGWPRREVERVTLLAHQLDEFTVHDTHHRLPGGEASHHLLPERALAHLRDEVLHHGQSHVGLQQRDTHLPQCVREIVLRDARFAAQRLHHAREALGQVVEHAMGFR